MKTYAYTAILVVLLTLPLQAQVDVATSSSSPPPAEDTAAYGTAVSATNRTRGRLLGQEERQTVFVIPAAEKETEDIAPILEDLRVMCRIFDKMDSSRMGNVPLIGALFENSSEHPTEALYLQGYGIVFFLKVPFALDFSEPEEKPETQGRPGTDPLWQSVREETLYGNRKPTRTDDTERSDAMNRQATTVTTKRLLRTLKYAANIRSLEPDEKIVIRITGQANSNSRSSRFGGGRRSTGYDMMSPYGGPATPYGGDPLRAEMSSGPAILIAHTTKADVDDYNSGTLTFEQFKSKAKLVTLNTHNVTPVSQRR